jgi:hypothetical protein
MPTIQLETFINAPIERCFDKQVAEAGMDPALL